MKWNRMIATRRPVVLALSILALMGAIGWTEPLQPLAVQGTGATNGIKVKVSCDAGQIDQQHRVTITICCPTEEPGECVEKTIVQDGPAQWHVNDIAVGIASKLNNACDLAPGTIWPVVSGSQELSMDLPSGASVKKIKTEKKVGKKWKERKGHLKVSSYSKTSNGLPFGAPAPGFSQITFTVPDDNANPVAVIVELLVDDGSGALSPILYEVTQPDGETAVDALADLQVFLGGLGMAASLQDDRTLVAIPDQTYLSVAYVSFGLYEDNDYPDILDPRDPTPGWDITYGLVAVP